MKRAILFLIGLSIMLANCCQARGQGCRTTLVPYFSSYNSVTRDGNNIHTVVSIQGYASVAPGPGCNMNSATHKAGAYNKLSSTGGWNYSASGCPNCYFSITNYEQIVGVPGVLYPYNWEGAAICSIVGTFWDRNGGSSLPGCLVPSSETTAVNSTVDSSETLFTVTVSDSAGDSFSGQYVQEGDASPAQDTCWFQGSNILKVTGVTGGPPGVISTANQFSDTLGWTPDAVSTYRTNQRAPCGATMHQAFQIMCNANTWWTYTPVNGNTLTATINQSNVVNCRYDMNNSACQTINY